MNQIAKQDQTVLSLRSKKANSATDKRLKTWKERQAKENPSFSFKALEKEDNTVPISTHINDQSLTDHEKYEIHAAGLCAATGTASMEYGRLLLGQTMSAFSHDKAYDATFIANATHAALTAMNPQDEYEGMLCSRLLVLHDQYMKFLQHSANQKNSSEVIDLNINRATKLMRLYNETLRTLERHRRKGEQKVIVQHVNVNNGGQAVVAGEFTGGGDNKKC